MVRRGVRATPKRIRVMALLLKHSPISAYDLLDAYRAEYHEKLLPTSAYRLLDVLIEAGIAHRVASINRYVACRHALCDHSHGPEQLLVCSECQSVQEVPADAVTDLRNCATNHGFCVDERPVPELLGQCARCRAQ